MSPIARAELRPNRRWTFADISDAAVGVICIVGLTFIVGLNVGRSIERDQERSCQQRLDDGRKLNAYGIGDRGHTRCTYEAGPRLLLRKG